MPDDVPIPAPADPSPLDEIVDDTHEKEECLHWLCDQMLAGRTPEELSVELIGGGWTSDDAEELTESARQHTRHARGVLTRQEVAEQAHRNYRRAMSGNWFLLVPTVSSLRRLIYSLGTLKWLRRPRVKQMRDHTDNPNNSRDN